MYKWGRVPSGRQIVVIANAQGKTCLFQLHKGFGVFLITVECHRTGPYSGSTNRV